MIPHTLFSHLVDRIQPIMLETEINSAEVNLIHQSVQNILLDIGEDPDRQGLVGTPDRVARMYKELTSGYKLDPVQLVNGAIFDVECSEPLLDGRCSAGVLLNKQNSSSYYP
jgi:GTP cyclohydrolase I